MSEEPSQDDRAPADITQWNAATPDWHCPAAELGLRAGGSFSYRMEARDGSMDFDAAARRASEATAGCSTA